MILRLRCFILYLTYILKPSYLTADKCSTENHIVRTFEEVKQGKYGVFFTSNSIIVRNSRLELFCQKTIFKIFAKFAGKYLSSRLFFSKVIGLQSATLFKKSLQRRCFPVNFINTFFTEHFRWLLLCSISSFSSISFQILLPCWPLLH